MGDSGCSQGSGMQPWERHMELLRVASEDVVCGGLEWAGVQVDAPCAEGVWRQVLNILCVEPCVVWLPGA